MDMTSCSMCVNRAKATRQSFLLTLTSQRYIRLCCLSLDGGHRGSLAWQENQGILRVHALVSDGEFQITFVEQFQKQHDTAAVPQADSSLIKHWANRMMQDESLH